MDIEKLLTNTFVIGNAKNIDPRYFKEGDKPGEYKLTYTFVYNIVRDALDFYKEQIFAQDTECLYHTEKMGVFKDTWAEKRNSEEMKLLYGEQFKEFEARKRKWREANPDKCEVRHGPVDLGDEDEMHFFAGYSPDFKPTLTQAVALYKYLKAYDTEHGDSLKATLPTKPDYLVVSSQYSDEYKALCDEWAKELGLPLETKQVGTVNRTKYSIKRVDSANFKQISASSDGLQDWVYGLIRYITSSDKEEYKVKRKEWLELINNDFVLTFNENSKHLKAEDNGLDETTGEQSIFIWTKTTEEQSPIKIITIKRDNPQDNFKYIFDIELEDEHLRYTKVISTKADLVRALETTLIMVEGTPFEKYSRDIQAEIDNLG